MSLSYNRAEYYVVRDVWVTVEDSGEKYAVIDVQGVRGDGSYWVTGFHMRVPLDVFTQKSVGEITDMVRFAVDENERKLDKAAERQAESIASTSDLRSTEKYNTLIGKRIDIARDNTPRRDVDGVVR